MKSKLLLSILLLTIAGKALSLTYYISPAGNDITGTGTITNPWRTIFKASTTVTASGNTIFLLPGVYTETAMCPVSPGVSIEATDTNTVVRSTLSAQFIPILVLSSAEGTNGNQHISNIKFDGTNRLTSWAISIRGRSNVSVYGCVFRNFEETAVNWSGRSDGVLTYPTIYSTGNSFHDNILVNCATYEGSYGRGAFQFGGQDGMQIYNNYIRTDERAPGTNGWPIKGCNNSWIKNCRIHHNTLLSAPYPYAANGYFDYWDFAIELFDNLGGNIIDSNVINGSIDFNRQSKGTAPFSLWIHHNTIGFETMQAHRQSGIILEYSTETAIVEYNTIKNTTDGIIFSVRSNSAITNTTIRNNNIVNLGSTSGAYGDGIGLHHDGSANYSIDGLFIYNNTLKCVSNTAQAPLYGINFSSAGSINNWRCRNNILIGFQEAVIWSNVASIITNSVFTHNYFYNNLRNTPFTNWQGTAVLQPSNTISNNTPGVNPLLQGGIANTITIGSPCIDAGINVGTPYSGTAPDIGWYEYGSIVPNVPPTANAGADQTITLPTNSATLTGSGVDTDGTITAYQWTKISGPAAGTITSASNAVTTITGLVQGVYSFELTVTDNSGDTGKDTVLVTVLPDPNIAPTANAGPDQSINLPTNTVTFSGSGTDPDGTIAAYQWTKIGGPAGGAISTPGAAVTTITGLSILGTYSYELRVTDNNGAVGRDTVLVTVNANPANIAPSANAGANQIIALPTNTVTLSGSGLDPDGSIAAYQWTKITGPATGTITNATNATTTVTGLVLGIYSFELMVTDNEGAVGRDTVIITVNPDPNIAPTANAGPDQTITLPTNTVTLSGSGVDTDGSITAYQWTKIAGPVAGTITNTTNATTTVTGLVLGIYSFELMVTDNNGAIGRDTVLVTVNPDPNIAPTANAGPDQTITLPTNTVTLNGSGVDPDGSITSYQWTKIAGPTAGTITTPASASTTVTGMVAGVYRFQLTVTDNNGAVGRDTVQITVNPAPNVLPTANAGPDQTITLPTNTVTLSGSGVDPDGNITAYQWTKIAGPTAGTITTPANATTTVTGMVAGVYRFQLRVTDNSGAFGRDTVQITVNPAPNVPPTANAGPDQTITLPTNTVTLTGSGVDPDGNITAYQWTKISGPAGGTITNATNATTTVTGLTVGVYSFELSVTDNSGATATDLVQITVNPAPNVPPTANAGADQLINLPTNNTTLSGSGADTDGNITAYQWTKIAGPAAGAITSPASAATTVTGLVAGIYRFELRVTDNSGAFGRDTITVVVNTPPVANAGADINITLPVNSTTLNGSASYDADGSIASYSWIKIAGPAAGVIAQPASATTALNSLIAGVYRYQLTVTDNYGISTTDVVQVVVFAPNVAPVANAGLDISVTLPTNSVTLSGSGSDIDGTIVGYLWTKVSGPAGGNISNNTTAVTNITGLIAGVYQFELRVTDNNGGVARDIVQVTVNPENIPPTANAGANQTIILPVNSVTLTGSGTDIDGTVDGYEWRQISGPADKLLSPYAPSTLLVDMIEGTYVFELTVTDNKGATGKDTVAVQVKPMVVTTKPNSINIYPNPVSTLATLEINRDNNGSRMLIIITEANGKVLLQKQFTPTGTVSKEIINFSNFAKGVYFVTVDFNSGERRTVKVIKQ